MVQDMKKLKVAVIGFGHLGRWHVQKVLNFSEQAELRYIVENFPLAIEAARLAHPSIEVVDDLKKIINEIDAAIVVTPTSFHFEVVKYLIENNKHVFCEKPVTTTLAQALQLKVALADKNLVVQVGHSERFHKVWESINTYKNFLTPPSHITLTRVAPFKGRATDVDVVSDLMIHDLDLLVYLFKEIPLTVNAIGFKMRTDKWDYVTANFTFKSGHRATITVGRNQPKEVRELAISNTSGTIIFDLMKNEMLEARGDFTGPDFVKVTNCEKRDHLLLEHQFFYDSILNSKKAIVSLDDGIIAVNLIEKVLKSIESGQEVNI
jgi:predicted dehydrogenase